MVPQFFTTPPGLGRMPRRGGRALVSKKGELRTTGHDLLQELSSSRGSSFCVYVSPGGGGGKISNSVAE
jgi:hypothetical protein